MSRLVRLYPRVWRDRYGSELAELLDERRPNLRDVADTILGAADAHLHPQLAGSPPQPWTHRVPGLLALAGGLSLCAGAAILATSGRAAGDVTNLVGTAFVVMFLSLPGDYLAGHGRRIGVGMALFCLCLIGMRLIAWELAIFLLVAAVVILPGGMLAAASVRAGIGSRLRWLIVALAVAGPMIASVPIVTGLVSIERSPLAVPSLVLPYGVAWVLIGLRMAARGAPTIVDPPLTRKMRR